MNKRGRMVMKNNSNYSNSKQNYVHYEQVKEIRFFKDFDFWSACSECKKSGEENKQRHLNQNWAKESSTPPHPPNWAASISITWWLLASEIDKSVLCVLHVDYLPWIMISLCCVYYLMKQTCIYIYCAYVC